MKRRKSLFWPSLVLVGGMLLANAGWVIPSAIVHGGDSVWDALGLIISGLLFAVLGFIGVMQEYE